MLPDLASTPHESAFKKKSSLTVSAPARARLDLTALAARRRALAAAAHLLSALWPTPRRRLLIL